jgi:hypothetical protein
VKIGPRALLIAALAVSACGQGTQADGEVAQDAAARRGIPQAVLDFEALAEDTYDKALSGDAGGVKAAAASMQSRWKKLRKTVLRAGLKDASARSLDKSVARLASLSASPAGNLQLARAANAVTDAMDDIFALYHPKAPPELMTLDFLGRELELDARTPDLHAGATHRQELQSEWAGVRPKVIKAGGEKEATGVDDALAAAGRAIAQGDEAELEKQAQAELELVDAIEHKLRW